MKVAVHPALAAEPRSARGIGGEKAAKKAQNGFAEALDARKARAAERQSRKAAEDDAGPAAGPGKVRTPAAFDRLGRSGSDTGAVRTQALDTGRAEVADNCSRKAEDEPGDVAGPAAVQPPSAPDRLDRTGSDPAIGRAELPAAAETASPPAGKSEAAPPAQPSAEVDVQPATQAAAPAESGPAPRAAVRAAPVISAAHEGATTPSPTLDPAPPQRSPERQPTTEPARPAVVAREAVSALALALRSAPAGRATTTAPAATLPRPAAALIASIAVERAEPAASPAQQLVQTLSAALAGQSEQDVSSSTDDGAGEGASAQRGTPTPAPAAPASFAPLLSSTASAPPAVPTAQVAEAAATAALAAAAHGAAPAEAPVQTFRIQLQPDHLGSVTARLTFAGEQVQVEIEVEKPEAHSRIAAERETIARTLRGMGFDVEAVVVQMPSASGSAAAPRELGFAETATMQRDAQAQAGSGSRGERGAANGGDGRAGGDAPGRMRDESHAASDGASRGLYI